jgi:predicted nucleic acid-binding protein
VGLLIDSTVFIHAERARHTPTELISALLDRFGDEELALSVMSAGELFHGCCRADTPRRRARREDFVEAVMSALPSIPITLPVMRIFGRLDADLTAGGDRLPTSDLLIASTALSRDDEIVTGNLRHFRRISGLVVKQYS